MFDVSGQIFISSALPAQVVKHATQVAVYFPLRATYFPKVAGHFPPPEAFTRQGVTC